MSLLVVEVIKVYFFINQESVVVVEIIKVLYEESVVSCLLSKLYIYLV